MSSGHAGENPLPAMPSKGSAKSTAIQNIGRLNVIAHFVTILNIVDSFCCSPLLYSSAIVGENIVLKDCKGIEIKIAMRMAAPYCPIATLEIANTANNTVSTESSTVSTIEV